MDESFFIFLGCSAVFVALVLPVVLLVMVTKQRSRLAKLESALTDIQLDLRALSRRVAEGSTETLATAPATVSETAPATVSETAPTMPPAVSAASQASASALAAQSVTGQFPETGLDSPIGNTTDRDSPAGDEESSSTPPPEAASPEAASAETGAPEPSEELPPASPAAPPSPPSPPSPANPWWQGLEETLWTRLPVWLGAAAVALSAAFLVKMSLERGWIQPPVRVSFGALLGVSLLVFGERLRRSSAYVAQGLSAAGIASLFVSFYAATELYHLVPAWLGFVLMALTTATAVVLSLRQGYVIATIGLIGGFLTPALVSSGSRTPSLLFAYLLLLQVGLLAVSRRKRWASLGALTLAAGLIWIFTFLGGSGFSPADAVWVGLFLIASVATFLSSALSGGSSGAWGSSRVSAGFGWGASGGGLVAGAALLSAGHFGTLEWLFFGLLALGCLVVARFDESYHGLAWVASMLVTLLLAGWMSSVPESDAIRCLVTTVAFGALLVVGAYAAHFGSVFAGRFTALAAVLAVVDLLLLVGSERQLGLEELHWGGPALGLAVLFILAALPVARRRVHDSGAVTPLASLAVGVAALVALAFTLELERAWLSVTWALLVLALVWLSGRLRLPALETCAYVATAVVAVRLLANPQILRYPIGETPVANWLLYGYGVPILALGAAAWLATRQGSARLAETLQWVAGGLGFAFVTLQIRQYFFPGKLYLERFTLAEWGTYLITWLLLAYTALGLHERWPVRPLAWGGRALTAFSVVAGSLTLGLALNPLWANQTVGQTVIVNRILWSYGLPAALLALVAHQLARRATPWEPRVVRIASLVTLFFFVTLEVRQFFRGERLDVGSMSTAENYSYSFAWIVLGSLLAIAGVMRQSPMLRYGSLAVLLPAVFKVFLVDTSDLEGLYRVFSLFGLGVSLLVLAYVYQRFVFRPKTPPIPGEDP